MKLSKHRTGLSLGLFLALFHLVWLILVGLDFGQMVLDWIYDMHLLTNPFTIMSFEWPKALMLLAMTAATGYIFGWLFAFCWNKFNKNKK